MGCCSGKGPPEYDLLASPGLGFAPGLGLAPANENNSALTRAAPAVVHNQVIVCGFKTILELPGIQVADTNVAAYSLPKEALSYTPPPEIVVTTFANELERKIHCNTPLTKVEQRQLKELQVLAEREGLVFFPSVAVAAPRFLCHTRGNTRKALERMCATQKWRQDYFGQGPITDASLEEDLQSGMVYIVGRDFAMHPTIVCRANRIPQAWYDDDVASKRLLRCGLFCMEYIIKYMCVPGRVEENSMIFDMDGLGFTQVPITPLRELYSVFHNHYPGRAFRFNVCNLSPTMSFFVGIVRSILTERQRNKLALIGDLSELLEQWAPHQLEEDLGGNCKLVEKFFPFPIQPGPYSVGSCNGPDNGSPRNLHRAFKPDGLRGQFWDPEKSAEENTALEYSKEAASLFDSAGLPAPGAKPSKASTILRGALTAASSWSVQSSSPSKKQARVRGCFAWCRTCSRAVKLEDQHVVVTAKGDQVLGQGQASPAKS